MNALPREAMLVLRRFSDDDWKPRPYHSLGDGVGRVFMVDPPDRGRTNHLHRRAARGHKNGRCVLGAETPRVTSHDQSTI